MPRLANAPSAFPLSAVLAIVTTGLAFALAGCAAGGIATAARPGTVRIVAAESFWGSIAAQLGGARADVSSIISNPAQDPHAYEPVPADARALAEAQLAIVNDVGYDPWVPRLLAANPVAGRAVLTVGQLLRLADGDNPHRWYDPADVDVVANAITSDLKRLDPGDASFFTHRASLFQSRDLARYHALIARIRAQYGGTPVGASESIFALQAPALGLRLVTPPGFMKAVSEGTEATAADTSAAQRQLTDHAVKVWILNSQNVTPDVEQLNGLARSHGIPIATVTETLTPAGATFEQWQVAQLQGIARALHQATGR